MENKVSERYGKSVKSPRKVRTILIGLIRIILFLALFIGFFRGRQLVLYFSAFALFLTFIPSILEKRFNIKVPAKYEIIILFFIYGILFVAEVRGLYADFLWWDILLNLIAAIALGFIGLTVLFVLHRDEKINASPFVIAVFAFSFAVAFGAVWEIFEFSLDKFYGFNMQKSGLGDTMGDLIVNGIGAGMVSLVGYFYIKKGKIVFVSALISKFVEKNPKLFGSRKFSKSSPEAILDMIGKGEHKNLEFKSTLRTNLHTNQIDKKIEHSVLKTVSAYLNSQGGTLLVGVGDKGEILGVDRDAFPNNDKLNLHFTNLLKHHIGNEYLPFIRHELVSVDGKHLLKIDCSRSQKHVFLKSEGREEFYVRNGPASVKLSGGALIDYVNHNFKR